MKPAKKSRKARPSSVILGKEDLWTMQRFGLDPNKKEHVVRWARERLRAIYQEQARREGDGLWIRCEAKLPPYGKPVLVTCGVEVGHCTRALTDEKGEHWFVVDSGCEEFFDVVAWCEEPKIPQWAAQIAKHRKKRGKR